MLYKPHLITNPKIAPHIIAKKIEPKMAATKPSAPPMKIEKIHPKGPKRSPKKKHNPQWEFFLSPFTIWVTTTCC